MKTRLLQSIDLRRMRGEGEEYKQNLLGGPRRPLQRFLAMPDIYFHYLFLFFSFEQWIRYI